MAALRAVAIIDDEETDLKEFYEKHKHLSGENVDYSFFRVRINDKKREKRVNRQPVKFTKKEALRLISMNYKKRNIKVRRRINRPTFKDEDVSMAMWDYARELGIV